MLQLCREWVEVDVLPAVMRGKAFLTINPAGQVRIAILATEKSSRSPPVFIRYQARERAPK